MRRRARLARRWSPSARAATACTCGTGRSSCSSAPPRRRCAGSSSRWRSPSSLAELCYRYVEMPVRQRRARARGGARPGASAAGPSLVAALRRWSLLAVAATSRSTRSTGPPAATTPRSTRRPRRSPRADAPRRSGRAPRRRRRLRRPAPRRVTIVGDSQAHALAINLPDGIESTFAVTDGVARRGAASTTPAGCSAPAPASTTRSPCAPAGPDEWAPAVAEADAEVALVVLGAWDVFDLEHGDGTRLAFGTPEWDAYVRAQPAVGHRRRRRPPAPTWRCSRCRACGPVRPRAPAVPPLPERADDARVAHVNELLRSVAAADPGRVAFVEGPDAWCADETDRHRPRLALGRRARLQARCGADLRDDRPGAAGDASTCGLTWRLGRARPGVGGRHGSTRIIVRQVHRPGHDDRGRHRGRRHPAGPAQRAHRPRAHAEARPLERRRSALHRRARDARPAGRRPSARWSTPRPSASPRSASRRNGTPGALVATRTWDDYDLGRAGAIEHLGALDAGVQRRHRGPPQGRSRTSRTSTR